MGVKNAVVNALTLTEAEKKSLADGTKCYDATTKKVIACGTKNKEHIDYDYIKCTGGSGMPDLLPLLMMGDSSSSSSDLLPLMMMSGGMGGGAAGGMDPMMMMLMMDDNKSGKEGCDSKHEIKKIV